MIVINGQVVGRREATVWLYPNIPGRQDVASGRPLFRLRMAKGIAVYPQDAVPPGPRLPLLGLPAFLDNDLDWWLDPERRHITVQPRTWRRPLIRLLCRLQSVRAASTIGTSIEQAPRNIPSPCPIINGTQAPCGQKNDAFSAETFGVGAIAPACSALVSPNRSISPRFDL